MSKDQTITLASNYPGKLVLPSGAEILPGSTVELTEEEHANKGVQDWIKDGWLLDPSKVKKVATSEEDDLRTALTASETSNATLRTEVTGLKAELEKAAKEAEDLTAKLAASEEALKAAKAPKP